MPGGERGILGVRKDPKNQILFSYGGEDWPSDDSDDEDYQPTEAEADEAGVTLEKKGVKRNKCKKSSNDVQSSKKQKKEGRVRREDSASADGDLWGQRIPPMILMKIFRYVVASEGTLPFLCRAARLSYLWYETTLHASLWQNVDLSYGWIKSTDQTLTWLSKHRFAQLREINLSSWKNLTNAGIEALCDSCPSLKTVNLAHCSKINSQAIRLLADKCSCLRSIDLSFAAADAVSPQSLKYLVEKQGANLRQINLSGNMMKGFNSVLTSITMQCPILEVFEVCNSRFSSDFMSLNIERMQEGCPRLRVLRLANSKFRASSASVRVQVESPGFPELEELSVAINPEGINIGIGMDDNFLKRLLKTSHKLKLLDLRGSTHLTSVGLSDLPVTDLECLFLSQSSAAKYDGIDVIMQKWCHSLRELDLAWNVYPAMSLDFAMKKLASDPSKSSLEILNLSGTGVSCARVESLLDGCPNLKSLNICSCRGLARGMKREFSGADLDQLRKNIGRIVQEEKDNMD